MSIPQAYAMPSLEHTDNTTSLLLILIAPAIVLFFFCYPFIFAFGYADVLEFKASFLSFACRYFLCFCGIFLTCCGIAFTNIHTQHEGMIDYYNQVVKLWTHSGGQQVFQHMTSMNISSSAINPATEVVIPLQVKTRQVQATGDTTNFVPSTSIFFETNVTRDDISKIRILHSQVSNNENYYHYSDLDAVPFQANRTTKEVLSCYLYNNFCTQGCSYKYRYSRAKCFTGHGSPMRRYCESKSGVFTVYRSADPMCSYSDYCGKCVYTEHLTCVGVWMSRSINGNFMQVQPRLKYQGCTFPYENQDWMYVANVSASTNNSSSGGKSIIPTNITFRVFTTQDPKLALDRITANDEDKLPVSSKYFWNLGKIFFAVGLPLIAFTFLMYLVSEEKLCFSDTSSVTQSFANLFDAEEAAPLNTAGYTAVYNTAADADSGPSLQHSSENNSVASLDPNIVCQICYAKPRDCKFTPCLHHMCCKSCAQQIQNSSSPHCPLCRTYISGVESCSPQEPTYAVFHPSNSGSSSGSGGDYTAAASAAAAASSERNMFCQVCLSNFRDQKFIPCNHHVCCSSCAQLFVDQQLNCPIASCKARVESYQYCSPDEPTNVRFS